MGGGEEREGEGKVKEGSGSRKGERNGKGHMIPVLLFPHFEP